MRTSMLFQYHFAQMTSLKASGEVCACLLILLCTTIQAGVIKQEGIKDRTSPASKIEKVTWDVVGGGDMEFEIVRDSEDFSILITRYRFKQTHQSLQLTAAEEDAFQLAKGLFEGTLDPHTDTFVPEEHKYSGMFVSITLDYFDGHQQKIKNIKPSGKFRPVYDFVSNRAIEAKQE